MKYITIFIVAIMLHSCSYEKLDVVIDDSGFPPEISNILIKKCATAGCHNELSYASSAGLSLVTWNKMFEGSTSGAVVIPFRPDYSTLLFFTNTDSAEGLILAPNMPYNEAPLSAAEYSVLKKWILKGAPDKNGFVKFSDNPSRLKLYIANQGVDAVAVLDIQSNMLMRYIDVGNQSMIENPHMIKVSPDNQYWYSVFYIGNLMQKFRTSDNSLVAEANIGGGSWNTFAISSDSKKAYVVDMSSSGHIAVVNLETMSLDDTWNNFSYPHGSALNKTDDTLYVTAQTGNFVYKIPVYDHLEVERIVLDSTGSPSTSSSYDPHEIAFNADYSKFYVTCQTSNEVRVMRTSDNKLLSVIQTPDFPVEMAFSSTKPYLFVTCLSTVNAGSTILGQVYVIDVNTDAIIKSINTGHQPHGIAVCDELNRVYVSNRNASHGGPPSHHPSGAIRNGYITAIDLNTLDLIPGYKTEVSIDPYSITITH